VTVHAIEITLTRTIDAAELKAAQKESDLLTAAAGDQKRFVVLVTAKNERRAVRKIWRRLEDALPIDVLCTLFPGSDGKYLMSIPMSEDGPGADPETRCCRAENSGGVLATGNCAGTGPCRSTRRAQLECSLSGLFRTYSPKEVTEAAARRIGM
jgi:hypothetical protein